MCDSQSVPSCTGTAQPGWGLAQGGTVWLRSDPGWPWLAEEWPRVALPAMGCLGSWTKPTVVTGMAEQQPKAGIKVVTRGVGAFLSSFFLGPKVPTVTIPTLMSLL